MIIDQLELKPFTSYLYGYKWACHSKKNEVTNWLITGISGQNCRDSGTPKSFILDHLGWIFHCKPAIGVSPHLWNPPDNRQPTARNVGVYLLSSMAIHSQHREMLGTTERPARLLLAQLGVRSQTPHAVEAPKMPRWSHWKYHLVI